MENNGENMKKNKTGLRCISLPSIPLDVAFAPTLVDAMRLWREPKWVGSLAPWPGLRVAARMWRESAPLRDLA
jgi:hypothetical protein